MVQCTGPDRLQPGLAAQRITAPAGATPAARDQVRFQGHALQAKLECPAQPRAGSVFPALQKQSQWGWHALQAKLEFEAQPEAGSAPPHLAPPGPGAAAAGLPRSGAQQQQQMVSSKSFAGSNVALLH